MKLFVNHTTTYHYSEPQRMITQSHRLIPASCNAQKIVRWEVTADGAEFGRQIVDGAGDTIRTMSVDNLDTALEIHIQGEVDTFDTNGVYTIPGDVVSPQVYLRDSPLTKLTPALVDLARDVVVEEGNVLNLAHALMRHTHTAIEYTTGATKMATTAAAALALGKGVCQDYAHCLLAIARQHQIPARYVTGYLLTDTDGYRHDASHAWVELNIVDLGWVGFDPTNNCCPDARYIRVGSGIDAQDAALIRGISRGVGQETMQTSVNIQHAQQ
ncbi:transglutaminase [Arenicella chitinivorans]|uniref:Transglutaminase n=1 Tax=Arenicella chitinivorans TaxID=1329800 RepID=A0A918RGY0_9GAMM|nr:transglutaminase family protein [Arenicella chitinivorans]GGZ96408.1 transglutaminase [Arenicella chitinivorans]